MIKNIPDFEKVFLRAFLEFSTIKRNYVLVRLPRGESFSKTIAPYYIKKLYVLVIWLFLFANYKNF